MKTLLLLRHAKSSWKEPGQSDHDRPLNDRGERDAPRMGRLLRDEGLVPDLIVSSTAERAQRTASRVAKSCDFRGPLELAADLYEAAPSDIVAVLRGVAPAAGRVLLVGHNPGMQELLSLLTGRDDEFPTAALAHLELPVATWREVGTEAHGRLVRLWKPRELDD